MIRCDNSDNDNNDYKNMIKKFFFKKNIFKKQILFAFLSHMDKVVWIVSV